MIAKLTQNQKLLLNALLSMLLTAIMAAIQAEMQKLSTGTLDAPLLINTALVIFSASFGTALAAYIPAHAQQELEALRDTVTLLKTVQPVNASSIPQRPSVVVPDSLPTTFHPAISALDLAKLDTEITASRPVVKP